MSDEKDAKKPSHIAYHVRENGDGKAYFNRVGSAFEHKDGEGYNVMLDAVPLNGIVTLRTPSERLEAMKNGGDKDHGKAAQKSFELERE